MERRKQFSGLKDWFYSKRSDLFLWILIILLLNIALFPYFLRFDLTRDKAYSLSPFSRRLVRGIEEPLQVNIFFSADLPAPYNAVERYLRDLMEEYQRASGPGFTVRYYNMNLPESRQSASDFGLRPVQIQEIKRDQFQSRSVHMGLVILYRDSVEVLDELTDTLGLEYLFTTTLQRMISTVDRLHGLSGALTLTLYASQELSQFNITGFENLERTVERAVDSLSRDLKEKLQLRRISPDTAALEKLRYDYGIRTISWQETSLPNGTRIPAGTGALELILSYGDRFRAIPLELSRNLFGGYALAGLEDLPQRISDSIQVLFSDNPTLGYLSGHGELSLFDEETGAAGLRALLSGIYTLREVTMEEGDIPLQIPEEIRTLIINGPKTALEEKTLYALDQFLLRGGNLVLFLDPFAVPQAMNTMTMQMPQYHPLNTGIEKLLKEYGVILEKGYVLDENSYQQQHPQFGTLKLYWAPILDTGSLSRESPITANLGQMILLQAGPVRLSEALEGLKERRGRIIAQSSKEGWVIKDNIQLNPLTLYPAPREQRERFPLAITLEGNFSSAFPESPLADGLTEPSPGSLSKTEHLLKSVAPGRIAVVGTSLITTPQLLDPYNPNTNAAFVHNLIDWASGNTDTIVMRNKGLGRSTLIQTSPEVRNLLKIFALGMLPLLVIFAGFLSWRIQRTRRKRIEARFAGGSNHA